MPEQENRNNEHACRVREFDARIFIGGEQTVQFYRFWARGESTVSGPQGSGQFHACGYSNASLEDALRVAHERANTIGQRVLSRSFVSHIDQYYSVDTPLREEIVEELQDHGQTVAIISRNSYGCLILNTTNIFFADIDQPATKPASSIQDNPIAKMLFGFLKKQKALEPLTEQLGLNSPGNFEEELIGKIEQLVNQDPALLIRLYRTKNGFRAVILNEPIPCEQARSAGLLKVLGSDQLYVSLCRSQDCYRARLTPKPWRCDYWQPTLRFPFDEAQRKMFNEWLQGYNAKAGDFATCALIGNFGSGTTCPLAEKIIQVHDLHALNDPALLA